MQQCGGGGRHHNVHGEHKDVYYTQTFKLRVEREQNKTTLTRTQNSRTRVGERHPGKAVTDLRGRSPGDEIPGWAGQSGNPASKGKQEFTSYMSEQTQKHQSTIAALSDQSQQELQELGRQREETVQKYEEQASGLKMMILEKKNDLALLNLEIAELREFKVAMEDQLGRIADLEQEVSAMRCRHSDALQALKSDFLMEKERYEAQAKHKVQELTLSANREASRCLLTHVQDVTQENQRLREELQQLIQRANALRSHQMALQTQHRQLLLEREHKRALAL
ncbi:coiled-coil domain-containing protein 166-like [Brachyhypopomus gauderio]|uniref:coiled-coil domain-containing protein 166-like n=1 Tax=Brachyhypopomus gauderio TaxID=698409 RepID=UPI004042AB98